MTDTGLLWCCLFAVGGPVMIVINNHIFNRIPFPYPITTSAISICTTAITTQLLVRFNVLKLKTCLVGRDTFKRLLLPIALLSASSIALSNHALMRLSVSFAQMLKALAPVYILCLLSFCNLRTPTSKAVSAVFVISVGAAVASIGEVHFSPAGMAYQMCGDFLEAVKIVMIQMALSEGGFSVIDILYYVTPVTGICQLGLISIFERDVIRLSNLELVMAHWPFFAGSACLGALLSLAGPQVIKVTSALTLKLIGIVRNNVLVLSAMAFLGDKTTHVQLAGYLVSTVGFVWYSLLEAYTKERMILKSSESYGSITKL